MPLYEYKCIKCKLVTELIQKVSDSPLEKCDRCGGRLIKVISSPAIQFKGSGWYINDYAKKSKPANEEKVKPDKSKPKKKSNDSNPEKAPASSSEKYENRR